MWIHAIALVSYAATLELTQLYPLEALASYVSANEAKNPKGACCAPRIGKLVVCSGGS